MSETQAVEEGLADAGRRHVTVLFADLSRSTEMATSMEAEHYATLLATLRRVYQACIAQHGGTVVRVQGDGLLAIFGHPLTREDDGRRAVESALDLHQRVRSLPHSAQADIGLSLHTGIHAGLVLLGAGDIERGRFELLGPVPNIAARLSDEAQSHEILVSEETLGPASRFFSTGAARSLRLKGLDGPILAYRVDARAGLAAQFESSAPRGLAPFIGRQSELEQLERRLAAALAGPVSPVALTGAPGMGKTRLAEQLLRRAAQQGWRVLRGYCESDLGAEPLQPFHHMLQALRRDQPHWTAEALCALFAGLAREQPLLLFIDDWQWADDGSNQVLTALRRLAGSGLFVLLSTRDPRPDEAPAGGLTTIAVRPLSDAEAAQAIAARLPGADPFVAAEIARDGGGNPLFIEELCHSAARDDGGRRPGRAWGGAGWLNRLVESRVQRLPPAQAELVRIAAVIGNVVPVWLLKQMSGQAADGPLVRGLAEQDFLFPGERVDTLRFKHGLTRDIIYGAVGLHERERLHLRIADAFRQHSAAQDETLEALAYHFDAGGDAGQAAHFAALAGGKALLASALDRARLQFRAALAALDKLPLTATLAQRWVAIVQQLGRVSVFDPSRSELPLFERALQLAERHGDLATVAQARHWLGYILYSLGDARAAIAHGERALAEARQAGDDRLTTRIVAALGEAHCAVARYEPALELLDQAIAVKRRHRSGRHTNVGLAFSLVCRAYLLGDRGLFEQSQACFDEALAVIDGPLHVIGASVHGWRSAVLLWQGRWAEARAAADASGHVAEATRSLTQLSIARAMSSYADWMLERRPASLQAIVDATAWIEPRASSLFHSLNHGWLADGLTDAGRRREARRHAALALQRSRRRDLIGVAMTYRALARDAAKRSPAVAQRYIELALRTARERDSAHEAAVTRMCAAGIALQQGQSARAAALLDVAQAGFDRMAMRWHLAEAARLQSLISSRAG